MINFALNKCNINYKIFYIKSERLQYENPFTESNGAIPPCAKRMCHFYRRETCMIEDYGHKCIWPYFWRQVDKDGNVLDRDGWIIYTKEKAEEIESRLKR